MTETSSSIPHPIVPDYDCTLVVAIELSNKSWVLAAQVPGLARVKAKQTIEPTVEALLAALQGYRGRFCRKVRFTAQTETTYCSKFNVVLLP